MKKITTVLLFIFTLLIAQSGMAQVDQEEVADFTRVIAYQQKKPLASFENIMSQAEYVPEIIEKISKPAEKTISWERYRGIFMTSERIAAGVKFWNENEVVLNQVSQESGVSIEAIVGIIGVETYFGQRMGSYRVLDALYTLGFGYPRRASFFKAELGKFLELCEQEGLDPLSIKGSYAGAMGYGQFMPSSYLAYAKSYDQDSGADLMNEVNDGIASVANYLKVHRWKEGQSIAAKANKMEGAESLSPQSSKPSKSTSYYTERGYETLAPMDDTELVSLQQMEMEDGSHEYWLTAYNFYVITRYNHSPLYALAVYQLGEAIKSAREEKETE
ncbi:lytic murein transglycosylase B [Reichenbachiella ulvae]|uniref:Lytic murein transglycosylase B n=1 Tax=Reichenbachiella ulvae TaxID=2980104 RepID=A0ABT3CQM4_9BACT|nr:lytic murein transglycosylase B [Reichenbachiella ulvae]MCV9385949.1 lytic murein transglycosylase B [Reichenbachiella ulvae]